MAIEIKAPESTNLIDKDKKLIIFLAGSIEGDKASPWQDKIVKSLKDYDAYILNPRRDEWDNSWKQEINNPQFNEQVTWELNSLDLADVIILYFDPETKSPISLLELGLYASSGKLIVICQKPFYRKGNVDIVCKKYNISQMQNIDDMIKKLKNILPKENK